MQISQLYIYPIKSLRGCSVSKAGISKYGLQYDRVFMLVKVNQNGHSVKFEHLAVSEYTEMVLFLTKITLPDEKSPEGSVTVTFNSPGAAKSTCIAIPLDPTTSELETIEVNLHQSPTKAYDMGDIYNTWFSACFGFDVRLVYLGGHSRSVLLSRPEDKDQTWFGSIRRQIAYFGGKDEEDRITFADCAQFLVVSETSLANVSSRLPGGEKFDMTKFRPNVVVSGAEMAWEEDLWAEIQVGGNLEIELTHNCARCKSINVDYVTGKPGTGEAGSMLKKLQKDRRIDKGVKFSPVFGRYGFLRSNAANINESIAVGEKVVVKRKNTEMTVFDWPGLTN